MANPSKRKGTSFEVAVVDFLQSHGFPYAERRAQRGVNDAGDVSGVVGWTLEVKNCRTLELGPWMSEAHTEAANDGTSRFAVIHKRRQHGTADAFVSMPLRLFAELLADDQLSQSVPRSEPALVVAPSTAPLPRGAYRPTSGHSPSEGN